MQLPTPPDSVGDDEVVKVLKLARTPGRGRFWLVTGLVLVLLLAVGGLFLFLRRPHPPRYETAEVTRGDLQVEVSATGTVQAVATVQVGAEVTGRAVQVLVDFNDRVSKGQLLAVIDPESYQAEVDQARAQVAAADAAIRQAMATQAQSRSVLVRAQAEAKEGLVAPRDLETALADARRGAANLASAQAQAKVARATLVTAQSRLDKCRIISPVNGIVLNRQVDPGQTVTAGFQTPVLFNLAEDLSRMTIHVQVDEADIGSVKEGQTAHFTVDAYPGHIFQSKLLSVRNNPTTVQNVVSYETLLDADNSELLLRPGMTATATIVAETHPGVLLIPNAALRFQPPSLTKKGGGFGPPGMGTTQAHGASLWGLVAGQPVAIPFKRGATDGKNTEVISEKLTPGTPVIIGMQQGAEAGNGPPPGGAPSAK